MGNQSTEQRNQSKRPSGSATGVLDQPKPAEVSSSSSPSFTEDRETLVEILRQMVLIRRFEEKCAESYSLGKIGGFCHLY
ncbi:MAG: hypothetical protein ACXW18_06315, partial [Pyrinomonadaceae bacterium]